MTYDPSRYIFLCGERFFVSIGGKPVPEHLRGVKGAFYRNGEWHSPGTAKVGRERLSKRAARRPRGEVA